MTRHLQTPTHLMLRHQRLHLRLMVIVPRVQVVNDLHACNDEQYFAIVGGGGGKAVWAGRAGGDKGGVLNPVTVR